MSEFQTILCPVDLSDLSGSAFPVALSVAGKYGATLLLVHVVDDSFPYPEAFAWSNPGEDFYKAMRESGLEEMGKLEEGHDTEGVEIERIILQGRPHAEVLSLAEQKGVDLIVLSTRGRSGLDQVLMGSQAEKIVHGARCPVLIVKPKEE